MNIIKSEIYLNRVILCAMFFVLVDGTQPRALIAAMAALNLIMSIAVTMEDD